MGFGSDFKKKFKQTTGVGLDRAALASVTGGLSELNIRGAEAAGADFSDPFGTQAEIDALRAAGDIEGAAELENIMFRREVFGGGKPFRERADVAGRELLSLAQAPIGESPEFQRDIQEGLVQQRLALGAFGLGDSTTFGTAAGRTTADVIGAERGQKINILQFLAGGAETGVAGAVGAQGLATDSALARAQSIANVGQAEGAGKRAKIQTGIDLLTLGGTVGLLA